MVGGLMVLQLAEHVVPSASRSTGGLPGKLVRIGGLAGWSTGGLQGKLGRVGGLAGDVVPSAGRSTGGLPERLNRVGGRGGVRGKGLIVWSPSAWSPFVGVFFVLISLLLALLLLIQGPPLELGLLAHASKCLQGHCKCYLHTRQCDSIQCGEGHKKRPVKSGHK